MWYSAGAVDLKILVISQCFWPENFRINNLVTELMALDHTVTVLTGTPNHPNSDYDKNPDAFLDYHGAEVVRVPFVPKGTGLFQLMLNYISFFLIASTLGLWKIRKQQFDVVLVFGVSPVTVGIPAIIYRMLTKTPVIFWVLDLWPESVSAVGALKSPFLLKLIGKLVSFIYNRCDLVLGQSKSFLDNITQYCNDHSKVHYFPNWAENIYKSKVDEGLLAPEITKNPDVFSILFAGTVGDAQDFPTILDAAESLKNEAVRWLIVGTGRKTDWLEAEVKRRNLQNTVLLLGRFPLERMPSFYGHADALLVTLKEDPVFAMTIPGKLQSYLEAGIPIVGALDGEGAMVIRDAQAGIASRSGNAVELAQAVRQIAATPQDERAQMGRNGQVYAEREFGREVLIARLEHWMQELVRDNVRKKNCR